MPDNRSSLRCAKLVSKIRKQAAMIERLAEELKVVRSERARLLNALQNAGYEIRRTKKGLRVA